MTINIYVTEKEDNNELSELLKEISELKEVISHHEKRFAELNETISELKKSIHKDAPQKPSVKKPSKTDFFEPSETHKVSWENLRLNDNAIEYINKRKAKCTIPLSIYELDFIRECDKQGITKKDYYKLCEQLPVSQNTVSKAIYNIRHNKELTHLLDLLHNKVKHCRFELTNDGFLKIGKTLTSINKELALEWCVQCQNNDDIHKIICLLHKAYPEIDKMQIKIVCENYDNSKLLDLIKEEKKPFIENNPSKRRNIIENNGGILK